MTIPVVETLSIYPVKACRGQPLAHVDVVVTGFRHAGFGDREWMIVDADRRFVTQREIPRLARIEPETVGGGLVLRAPGMEALAVASPEGRAQDVVVWRDTVHAFDAGEAASAWLSRYAGTTLSLVRFDARHPRRCNPQYAGDSGAHTCFADGYPVLVTGRASLDDLNGRLARKGQPEVGMERFRPNLVLAGLPAYDEDHLASIEIGEVSLRLVKPCTRCRVTTTDPSTAEVGDEPLATLAGYRMDPRFDGVTFGMNAIVERGGRIALGDAARCEYRFG